MNVPGLRSFAAKSPLWPTAGCEDETMVVILTKEQGPLVLFGGICNASFGRVWRVILWTRLSVLE